MKSTEVQTSKLFVGETNVRKGVGDVGELVDSIKAVGVLQPLVVRRSGKKYEVVVGSRRLEAARIAGLKKVPVNVTDLTDDEAVVVSLTENIQRATIDPEEEYDAFMKLREIGSRFDRPKYQRDEELGKLVGKSRQHVAEVIKAVEAIRGIRKQVKTEITVKQAPSPIERQRGVLPLSQATLLHSAEQSRTVQRLPEKMRAQKLEKLAETIAPLPRESAQRVVEHFVMRPERPIEKIKEEAVYSHVSNVVVSLDPRVADALRKAAQDRGTTMESLAAMAVEVWLKGWKYLTG